MNNMNVRRMAAGMLMAALIAVPLSLRADALNIVNASFETGNIFQGSINPGIAGWTDDGATNGFWLIDDTIGLSDFDPYEPFTGFQFLYANRLAGQPQPDGQPSQPLESRLSQTIPLDTANLALVQVGTAEISLGFRYFDTDPADEATVTLTFLDASSAVLGSITTGVLSEYPAGTPYDPFDAPWVPGTLSGPIDANTTAVRLDISTRRTGGTATNLSFDDFVGNIAETPLYLVSRSPAPGASLATTDFPLTLGAELVDGASTVDPGSIGLILNGTNNLALGPGDVVKTATTTTVSHLVSSLEPGAYTVSLVYAGTSPAIGPLTNTWSFTVQGDETNLVFIANGSFETATDGDGSMTPGIAGWTDDGSSEGFWVVADNDPGSAPDPFEPADGLLFLYANRLAGGASSQPIDSTLSQTLFFGPANLDLIQAGPATISLDFSYYDSDVSDEGTVTLTFLDAASNELSSLTTGVLPQYPNATVYDPVTNTWLTANLSGTVADGATAVRLDIQTHRLANSASNLSFDNFVASIVEAPVVVVAESPAPGALLTSGDFPVTLGGALVDGSSTLDSGSIALVLDGTNTLTLAPGDVVKVATTTTVSHVVSTLDPGVHSLSLVYAGIAPTAGPFTSTWSFVVAPDGANQVYVDATTSNTLAWDGVGYSAWTPDGVGSNWTTRTGFANDGQVYQSQFAVDSPRLQTTVSNLADSTYHVYAYMWVAGPGGLWRMEASLTDAALADLPRFITTDYPSNALMSVPYVDYGTSSWDTWATPSPSPYFSTELLANPFGTNAVAVAEGNRRLMEIYLGTVSGTEITVYVDDDSLATDQNLRTWYDGIGYEDIGGGGFKPVIQSLSISGGTITLQWTSEAGGTYSIMHKSRLGDSVWTPMKTQIPGGTSTTSDSVNVGPDSQGFYGIDSP